VAEVMSGNEVLQNTRHIYELVDVCVELGVSDAVLCPGSRCAPLLIGFGRHPAINTISVTDERSAAFIGLGLAQQTAKPVVLVCTSGTAGQNFAPAVTEAYYQLVPLLVLTADRPSEWIDQWDGQTIHQQGLYGHHIKASMDFNSSNDSLQKACHVLQQAVTPAPGPVHINIPVSKPFYPQTAEDIPPVGKPSLDCADAIPEEMTGSDPVIKKLSTLKAAIEKAEHVLIMLGQHESNKVLQQQIEKTAVPVIGDIISNTRPEPTEVFFNEDDADLSPDLLITIGRSLISEKQKQYFRKHKPSLHWHVGLGMVGDPFQSLTDSLSMTANQFFDTWLAEGWYTRPQQFYRQHLEKRSHTAKTHVQSCLSSAGFNQYAAIAAVLRSLPGNSALHLANSMSVRSANFVGLPQASVEVWSNRGTSGIDGCVSSAVGHALASPEKMHTLITGDLAFLYDRNGLWLNRSLPENLKIVVVNNKGGGIFRQIPGPTSQPGLEDLFIAPHQRTARLTAEEFDLNYQSVSTLEELQSTLLLFFTESSGILELFTDPQTDDSVFKLLMKRV